MSHRKMVSFPTSPN